MGYRHTHLYTYSLPLQDFRKTMPRFTLTELTDFGVLFFGFCQGFPVPLTVRTCDLNFGVGRIPLDERKVEVKDLGNFKRDCPCEGVWSPLNSHVSESILTFEPRRMLDIYYAQTVKSVVFRLGAI